MTDSEATTVRYAASDGVARVTLARPQYRNAQSVKLLHELDAAFARARADSEVRVIVLDGEGPAFSAGHDLGTPDDREEVEWRGSAPMLEFSGRSWELYSELTLKWRELPKPTIAAVHGYCIYAGWSLASAMDVIVAADDARFLPHLSEYFSLPWVIGPRRAKQVLFTNRMLDAEEALRMGMVGEVVPAAELRERSQELAEQIAAGDPDVLRLIKAGVNAVEDTMGFRAALRTGQAYNLLAYHGRGDGEGDEEQDKGRVEISRVRDALDTKPGSGDAEPS